MKKPFTLISAVLVTAFALNLAWALAQEQDVTLELRTASISANAGDEVTVEAVLKNPDRQSLISVRSWLEYNPAHLEGMSVETKDSLFTLAAPGEDGFESENGWVKIGRSNISGGVKDPEAVVATVKFKVKTASGATTLIKPYDYQVTELGHVSVNIIDQGFPVNVLAREPEALALTLNSGAPSQTSQTALPPISTGGFSPYLIRPMGLKVSTGSGFADLAWENSMDPRRTGYYLYYGKESGRYIRRRTVTNVTQTRVDNLPNGEVYFFAVTSYDATDSESDYSDEVGVIVGEPLSSTAPFPGLLQATLGRLPNQPANGPLAWWLLISAVGLSGTILFKRQFT